MRIDFGKLDLITIIVYLVLVVFLVIAAWAESRDLKCPEFKSNRCGPGMGSAYAAGKPKPGDSIKTLLQKLRISARYEVNSILWRRAFIAAIISAFVVLYVTRKRLPNGFQLGSAFLIIYIIFYMTITLFQRWVTDPALAQIDTILNQIDHQSSRKSSPSWSEGSMSWA